VCHRADHREPESVDAESVAAVARLRAELRRAEREIRNLRRENEVLREAAAPLIHGAPARERFAFIDARRGRFSVKLLCSVPVTDRGSYYAWVRAGHKRREREYDDRRLTALILAVHTAHPAYGVPRVTRELQRQGVPVGRRIVTRLMQQNGISGITRRRRRNLTKADAGAAEVPDLIRRQFTAPMPGLKVIGDISCFRTGEGWLYLATAVDLCSKEVIGYVIAPHMRASLAIDAVGMAHRRGLLAGNAIMHTDRGSQYHAKTHQIALRRLEIRQNTGRTGSCLDGAAAESFFATIKSEIGADSWPDRATARRDIENWITTYNERRLHPAAGYRTPTEQRIAWQQRMSTAA
jgi:transposase InsO family protein